jgi:subtilisin family serine protease
LSSRSRVLILAAALVALVLTPALPAAGGDAGQSASDPQAATTSHVVTLITGDVVRVTETGGETTATLEEAAGSHGGIRALTIGDDLYVLPEETLPYLASGRLDRELLNVTALIEQGYDDKSTSSLPLIAQYASDSAAAERVAPPGSAKKRDLASIDGAAISTTRGKRDLFWETVTAPRRPAQPLAARFTGGITKLWLDGKVEADLADSVPQVGAPQAWAAGFDGTGATVAVLDTGIDATHPDLVDRITETQTFVPGQDVGDRNGHGTHVASTILGSGAASAGLNKGVAPGAKLVVGKVLGDDGFGQNSWLIDGMEWAADRAKVVNMSLGDPEFTDGLDPMSQAVNQLTRDEGVLFVVAAGNSGSEFAIGSPGAADEALTVGAVDGLDQRAWFSSMGPRSGDHALKPDLSAPGVEVTAARSQQMEWGEGMYQTMEGTSMASPHVAGAAAILAAAHPAWSPRRLKDALMSSAKPLPGTTPYEVGTGRLDVPGALAPVHATGSAFLGFYGWPHDGDAPVSRTITYTNDGGTPVVLELSADSPELFRLSQGSVTVPAGGSVDVNVTADADDAPGVGRFTGFVVATDASGTVQARTAIGLVKEDERYDLNVRAVDRDGAAGSGFVVLFDFRSPWATFLQLDPETGAAPTQRLAPGPYNISTWMDVRGSGGPDSAGIALLAKPHFVLERDSEVVLDARKAKRITVTTPRPSENRHRRMQFFHDAGIPDGFSFMDLYFVPPNVDDMYALPTGTVPGVAFDFATRWRRSTPLLDVSAHLPAKLDVDFLYQGGSSRLDGKVRLEGVYAGTGTAAEYEGLKANGKAVVIRRSDTVQSWDWIAPAQAAGAELLIVANDRPGKLAEFVSGDLPVVSVTKSQGDRLIAAARAGKLTLRGEATAFPPYMYDLVLSDDRGIPTDLSLEPRARDLAEISLRFLGAPGLVFEARGDCHSYSLPPCWGASEPVRGQSTRTDYVSTEGARWYQDVLHNAGWEQRHDQVAYDAGKRYSLDWFAPITRPRLGPGYWGPTRDGDWMSVNVPFVSGGNRMTGHMWDGAGTVESRLYHGDELLAEQPFQAVFADAPTPELAEYRFVQDATRPADPWRTAIRTHTAWTFESRRTAPLELDPLPLLQLDYAVDTDLKSNVEAGRPDVIGISAKHEPGAVGGGSVRGVTLALSYDDGATWKPLWLKRATSGGWQATVAYPRSARGGYVSLKATAWDSKGNRVVQEIIRAYGLR